MKYFRKNIVDILFVSAFLLFIALPNIHLSRAKISEKENRTLEVYKPLFADRKINLNYGKDFEAFYSDRFFTRRWLLSINESFRKIFMPPKRNNKIVIGKKNWLFYLGDNSERNFSNLDYLSDKQLENTLAYLSGIKEWCDKNGKVFVYFIAPDKNKVYGEYFPRGTRKVNPDTESRAIQLIDYIHANSDINIVYPLESLLQEKSKWGGGIFSTIKTTHTGLRSVHI